MKIGSYFDGIDFNLDDIINLSALSDERQQCTNSNKLTIFVKEITFLC